MITSTLLLGLCMAIDMRSYPAYSLRTWLPMRMHLTALSRVRLGDGGQRKPDWADCEPVMPN
jgi:hypothetical protein